MKRTEKMSFVAEGLWEWFERHKRVLPWRDLKVKDDTQRAYMILVSEIMLQQTQVTRVEVIFKRFLREFPTVEALAGASNKEVILAWRGMGYNSRALRLRDAARQIVDSFLDVASKVISNNEHGRTTKNGSFPKEMDELLAIPGIGPYTAAAIRNFAFNIPTPCIDTNIRRILHRVFFGPEKGDGTFGKGDRELMKVAEEVLNLVNVQRVTPRSPDSAAAERGTSRGATRGARCDGSRRFAPHHDTSLALSCCTADWHAALMDFGSLVCIKRSPKCDLCPLAKKNLCKSAFKVKLQSLKPKAHSSKLHEPGRLIAGKFVPNRIIRGRIVEELRDAERGLSVRDIGARVCIDWEEREHRAWLEEILGKLINNALIRRLGKKYLLRD